MTSVWLERRAEGPRAKKDPRCLSRQTFHWDAGQPRFGLPWSSPDPEYLASSVVAAEGAWWALVKVYTISLPGHLPARRPSLPDVRGPASSWSCPVTPIRGAGKNSRQYLGRNYFQCVAPRFHSYYDTIHAGRTGRFVGPDYNTESFVWPLQETRWVS